MKITAWVIGIGSGAPEQLTGAAVTAMNAVDLFLVADKGPATHDLAELRTRLCATVIQHEEYRTVEVPDPPRDRRAPDYDTAVRSWHADRGACYRDVITTELPDGGSIGFLVWGDPSLYDSTIRVAESLAAPGLEVDVRVVPGLSSPQLLAAAHRIVLNRIGRPVLITTGRRLVPEFDPGAGDVVVMLDAGLACADLVDSHPDLVVHWAAQLGLPDETLVAGRLADVITEIRRERHRVRELRGWVLDIYLLRAPA